MNRHLILCSISLASLLAFAPILSAQEEESPKEEPISIEKINNAAHLLAGIPARFPGDEALFETQSFTYHQQQLDREFKEYTDNTLGPMREWAAKEVAPNCPKGSVLRYMFSGPDILHAYAMFPNADTYIMCGLEKVGAIPDLAKLTPNTVGTAQGHVRKALGEVINYSYFITRDMMSELQYVTFRGITPIIMVFLARSGLEVKEVEYFSLQTDGTLTSNGRDSEKSNVVKIDFAPIDSKEKKTLYFFSTDLSNASFGPKGFQAWMEKFPKGNAYFKAASFLLHGSDFKDLREHLLEYSTQMVGDDSGIPFRYFEPENWDQHLYGVYYGPIQIFSWAYQRDMRSAYNKGDIPELPFGTGYKWRKGQSNLMRHVRKPEAPKTAEESEEKAKEEKPSETGQ